MRKIITFICVGIILLTTGCERQAEREPGFVDKYAYISKEDGWIQELVITEMLVGENKGKREFFIDGVNLKYNDLEGYYMPVLDINGNEIGKGEVAIPSYINNVKLKEEIKKINAYLNEKQFKETMNIHDIQELQLQHFKQEDIVTLVNQALVDPYAEKGFGEYNINQCNSKKIDILDGSGASLQLSYSNVYGSVRVVNIEYIYMEGTYLSDLVDANTADTQQREAQYYLDNLEKEIVNSQEVIISDVISPSADKEAYASALEDILNQEIKKQ